MRRLLLVLAASVSLVSWPAVGDDIEIYLNGASGGGSPYVHLMLDYRPGLFDALCTYGEGGSCSPPFMSQSAYDNLDPGVYADGDSVSSYSALNAVLSSVLSNPLFDDIYMSLVLPNKKNGGTILEGYKRLGDHREELIATLSAIPESRLEADAHPLQPKETYFEWFRYLNSGNLALGKNTGGNLGFAEAQTPVPDYDASIIDGGSYSAPFTDPKSCSKLFSMLVAMEGESQDEDLNAEISAELSPLAAREKFTNMLQYMHSSDTDLVDFLEGDQSLEKTWVISDSGMQGQSADWARAGGSGSVLNLDNPAQLEQDVTNAFKEVISVSSTFVAASVPVNVFNRAESLDSLFIALFEAQETLRWPGNIKKLKLVDVDEDGRFDEIQDANGEPGFETTGDNIGRISFDAVTFWTDVDQLPPGDGEAVPVDADGREVTRGGAGQKIPGVIDDGTQRIGELNAEANARQVVVEPETFIAAGSAALDDFDVTDATADSLMAALGAADRSEARELIAWGRGQDVDDEDGDGDRTEARSWILGDAIHSRPLALNYGALGAYTEDNPLIRLFFGTNDGLLHVIENTDSLGNETGREVAAFYPREVLPNLKYLRENTQASTLMRYGVDGAPAVFVDDRNIDGTLDRSEGDRAFVYFGLRRGGYSYYALDVSNPNITPRIRWKIEQTSDGDFDELGLTFSDPVVGKVRFGATFTDVLIFAGGYNGGWNASYTDRVGKDANDEDDSVGNAIYIVNARNGDLIWKAVLGVTGTSSNTHYEHAGMVDSIPSSVTALTNIAGNIHRLYVGDTGGAVWRVDLPEGSGANHRKDNWFVTKLAELGTDGANTDRRFFHAPDVVETFDNSGDFDGILISSGDRAHPLETDVNNFHFYLKDRLIRSGDPAVKLREPLTVLDTSLPDQTACIRGTEGIGACATDAGLLNGWKIRMGEEGEKGLASPLVDGGRVFLTSFAPTSGAAASCTPNEGQSFLYVVNLADGTAIPNQLRIYDIGPGIASGAMVVGDAILVPGGGIAISDVDGDGDLDRQKLLPGLSQRLFRIYWRELGIDKL